MFSTTSASTPFPCYLPLLFSELHLKFLVFGYVVSYSKDGIFKSKMNEMCDIFIMCFALFLLVTCFGWNLNADVVENIQPTFCNTTKKNARENDVTSCSQLPMKRHH
jgi:hypothetical protein